LKILLVNYRYFVSGGPERYMFNLKGLLESFGHTVVPFSIAYDANEPTPYDRYFPSPLTEGSEVYFRDQSKSPRAVLKTLERAFYSREVYRKLEELIDAERPDAAIVQHYLRKLSPAVIKCLADRKVPFVVRLSDFAMICPNAHLFRGGQPCELCVHGSLTNSIRYRCVQGSLAASTVNYAATRFHERAGYYDLINTFVVPSRFTMKKMVEGGYDQTRMVHIPTFVNVNTRPSDVTERPPVVVYAGRLESLKGVHLLLEATRLIRQRANAPNFNVRVIGTGEPEYVQSLQATIERSSLTNVQLEGAMPEAELRFALRAARCSVAPSIWYENLPNSVLESLAEGTPVIAPDHGSLPELVSHRRTGLLVPPGDPAAIAGALDELLTRSSFAATMGKKAVEFVSEHHSAGRHYTLLMNTLDGARRRVPRP
jgi:glycosyltransferase involved in cell wall biosynthesis